ncbi:sensor histidine kinase [Alicyclobacillaceae bacterium I2511]|nr:sensor histidine kinase [Alicyclobacillaceae bacterium I2511]
MEHGNLPVADQTDYGIKLVEEERRRIAQELHDGPAQAITNVSMRLDIIRHMLHTHPELVEGELVRLNSRVVALVNDIRRLIFDLRPIAIDEMGLVRATQELCQRSQDEWGIAIEVHAQGVQEIQSLTPAKQVALYRMVQEALTNIYRHAQARKAWVDFMVDAGTLEVSVRDDGRGFRNDNGTKGHYGLTGMRERAAYLQGSVLVETSPGQGTTCHIQIPLGNEPVNPE